MASKVYLIIAVVLFLLLPAVAQDRDSGTPALVSAPKTLYPKEAKDPGIGGRITVRVTVGETGEVLEVDDASGPTELCKGGNNDPRLAALRAAVVESLKLAKFTPAMKDGKPVKTTVWLSSTFDPTSEPSADGNRNVVAVPRVTDKAIRMPKPDYPAAARPTRAGGAVPVRVVIDETGNVFTAEPIGGHPLLRAAAVDSACKAKFSPTEVDGRPVRITGVILYNFMPGSRP